MGPIEVFIRNVGDGHATTIHWGQSELSEWESLLGGVLSKISATVVVLSTRERTRGEIMDSWARSFMRWCLPTLL